MIIETRDIVDYNFNIIIPFLYVYKYLAGWCQYNILVVIRLMEVM